MLDLEVLFCCRILKGNNSFTANPSVFNFYLFLRMHPLVVRRQRAQTLSEMKKTKALSRQESQSESSDIEVNK